MRKAFLVVLTFAAGSLPTRRPWLCVLALAAALLTPISRADMVYNYPNGSLLDTSTGLYWQELQIPTNSFVPSRGSIASNSQINQLTSDAGLTISSQTIYSTAAADFVAFFADGQAATTTGIGGTAPQYFTPAMVYSDPPWNPAGFDAWEFEYTGGPAVSSSNWQFTGVGLGDELGPSYPCAGDPLFGCGQTITALVVSTAPPVPLPASAWLLASGLGILGAFGRKRLAASAALP